MMIFVPCPERTLLAEEHVGEFVTGLSSWHGVGLHEPMFGLTNTKLETFVVASRKIVIFYFIFSKQICHVQTISFVNKIGKL